MVIVVLMSAQTESRTEKIPKRMKFSRFPDQIVVWKGKRNRMEHICVDEPKIDDYILTDYSDGNGLPVNFYAAYCESQVAGDSTHSPRNCLSGGGWKIKDSTM